MRRTTKVSSLASLYHSDQMIYWHGILIHPPMDCSVNSTSTLASRNDIVVQDAMAHNHRTRGHGLVPRMRQIPGEEPGNQALVLTR